MGRGYSPCVASLWVEQWLSPSFKELIAFPKPCLFLPSLSYPHHHFIKPPTMSSAPSVADNPSNESRDPAYFGYYAMLQHQVKKKKADVFLGPFSSSSLVPE